VIKMKGIIATGTITRVARKSYFKKREGEMLTLATCSGKVNAWSMDVGGSPLGVIRESTRLTVAHLISHFEKRLN